MTFQGRIARRLD